MYYIEAQEDYLRYLHAVRQASLHTLRNYRIDLTQFVGFLKEYTRKENIAVDDVTKRLIRVFLAKLHEGKLSKKSVARKLSSLRSFYTYLCKQQTISSNPFLEIERVKLDRKLPKVMTYEQVEVFFAQPNIAEYLGLRDRVMMEFFYSSGLRLSELVLLERLDVDVERQCVRVHGKGSRERIVPITKTALTFLHQYLKHPERHLDTKEHRAEKDTKALFLNKWGTRLSARSVDRGFREYLLKSGLVDKITPHIIRHTIATHLLEKGMDVKAIQALLGHRSLATTTIYTQVSSKKKKEVYDAAHPLSLYEDIT